MYRVSAYYWTKVIMEIPVLITIPFLYAIITYFGIGFTITVGRFFLFTFILIV
jgi:hypothetical protein